MKVILAVGIVFAAVTIGLLKFLDGPDTNRSWPETGFWGVLAGVSASVILFSIL